MGYDPPATGSRLFQIPNSESNSESSMRSGTRSGTGRVRGSYPILCPTKGEPGAQQKDNQVVPDLLPDPDSESGTGRVRDRVRNLERNRERPAVPEQVVPDFLPKNRIRPATESYPTCTRSRWGTRILHTVYPLQIGVLFNQFYIFNFNFKQK